MKIQKILWQKETLAFVTGLAVAMVFGAYAMAPSPAKAAQSPAGCTADNSVVNVSSDVATAVEGETITFTVTAGNPASADGCDIVNRTITLTLPNGTQFNYGPSDYLNPTALAVVGDEPYIADPADLVNGVWNATVEWDGTLKSVSDIPSNGDKGVSVFPILPLVVEKTVEATYDRDWDWTIEKVVDNEELLLAEGEIFTVNYDIEVTPTSEDVNHEVTGTITITNPSDNVDDATVTSVSDVLNVSGAATVTCPDDPGPWILAPGESLICTYEQLNASPDDSENTASVTVDGVIPAGDGDSKPVVFGNPANETDECVVVDDTNPLGPQDVEICADDSDFTLDYPVTFGPDGGQGVDIVVACDADELYPNTASFIANDTSASSTDDANVHVVVDCFEGCTLTQGYWKTHSDAGPAPYDDNWANIGDWDTDLTEEEEGETLAWSQTWLQVFKTPPKGGNVWYQLAHQWMAAYLNTLNGASVPADVQDALDDGLAWLEATNPTSKPKGAAAADAKGWASLLGSYNEGSEGVPHCDEQNDPV